MKTKQLITGVIAGICCFGSSSYGYGQKTPADYVNPLLGTATLWDSTQLGFKPTHRAWGAEVFPGASVPNAMVQLTPVTQFRSGSGYQYEDSLIYGPVNDIGTCVIFHSCLQREPLISPIMPLVSPTRKNQRYSIWWKNHPGLFCGRPPVKRRQNFPDQNAVTAKIAKNGREDYGYL